jgi:hypothetical protein
MRASLGFGIMCEGRGASGHQLSTLPLTGRTRGDGKEGFETLINDNAISFISAWRYVRERV